MKDNVESYPDFDDWRERAIETGLGFKVAPEDFCIKQDGGATKGYFT